MSDKETEQLLTTLIAQLELNGPNATISNHIETALRRNGTKYQGVEFVKKDGSLRSMNVHGIGERHGAHVTAYDRNKTGWRMVNLDTVKSITCGGSKKTFRA